MINKLDTAGLGYHVSGEKTYEKLGEATSITYIVGGKVYDHITSSTHKPGCVEALGVSGSPGWTPNAALSPSLKRKIQIT